MGVNIISLCFCPAKETQNDSFSRKVQELKKQKMAQMIDLSEKSLNVFYC